MVQKCLTQNYRNVSWRQVSTPFPGSQIPPRLAEKFDHFSMGKD